MGIGLESFLAVWYSHQFLPAESGGCAREVLFLGMITFFLGGLIRNLAKQK
jgi:hypothetical protein